MSNPLSATLEQEKKGRFSVDKVRNVCQAAFKTIGVRDDVAREVTACLLETSLRGIASHGVNLMPHYLEAVKAGRINPDPNFKFKQTGVTTGVVDADDSFGHAAASLAIKKAIVMAKEAGSGFVSVTNSSHFSACSYYSLQAAREDLIGFSTTHTDSIMVSTRSKKPFLGTNPLSFTFPCDGEEPICLDMATTQVTWNAVRLAKQAKAKIQPGLAVDENGKVVEEAVDAAYLLPLGSYKGYGLSFVVEILCSLMTNMPFGSHISSMYKDPLSQKRKLGHFVGAIDINRFVPIKVFKGRMKELVDELRAQEPLNESLPVLVPGDPEKQAEEFHLINGIPLAEQTVIDMNKFINDKNLSIDLLL